jgi:hypothetical protein
MEPPSTGRAIVTEKRFPDHRQQPAWLGLL